jgi:hypothetical protein
MRSMKLAVLAILLLIPFAVLGQTTTTYVGTIKDLTGTPVTSGRITWTLNAPTGGSIPGTGSFTASTVSCLINSSGSPVSSKDGVSPCTIVNNAALTPTGTSYTMCRQPYNITPGSCFVTYANGGTVDVSTLVPTPATQPSYGVQSAIAGMSSDGANGVIIAGDVTTANVCSWKFPDVVACFGATPTTTPSDANSVANTAALRAAIVYGETNNVPIHVPPGYYSITPASSFVTEGGTTEYGAFPIASNMNIQADVGAIFRIASGVSTQAAPLPMAMFYTNGVGTNVTIKNLTMDMNGQNNRISYSGAPITITAINCNGTTCTVTAANSWVSYTTVTQAVYLWGMTSTFGSTLNGRVYSATSISSTGFTFAAAGLNTSGTVTETGSAEMFRRLNQPQIYVTGSVNGPGQLPAAALSNVLLENDTFLNSPGVNCIVMMQSNNTSGAVLGSGWTLKNLTFTNNGVDADDHSSVFGWSNNVEVVGSTFNSIATNSNGANVAGQAQVLGINPFTGLPSHAGPLVAYEIHGSNTHFHHNLIQNYFQMAWLSDNLTATVGGIQVDHNVANPVYIGVNTYAQSAAEKSINGTEIDNNTILFDATAWTANPLVVMKQGFIIGSSYGVQNINLHDNHVVQAPGALLSSNMISLTAPFMPGQSTTKVTIKNNTAFGVSNGTQISSEAADFSFTSIPVIAAQTNGTTLTLTVPSGYSAPVSNTLGVLSGVVGPSSTILGVQLITNTGAQTFTIPYTGSGCATACPQSSAAFVPDNTYSPVPIGTVALSGTVATFTSTAAASAGSVVPLQGQNVVCTALTGSAAVTAMNGVLFDVTGNPALNSFTANYTGSSAGSPFTQLSNFTASCTPTMDAPISGVSVSGGIASVTANNALLAGSVVQFSGAGLTGGAANLIGTTCTVSATGLSSTAFQCPTSVGSFSLVSPTLGTAFATATPALGEVADTNNDYIDLTPGGSIFSSGIGDFIEGLGLAQAWSGIGSLTIGGGSITDARPVSQTKYGVYVEGSGSQMADLGINNLTLLPFNGTGMMSGGANYVEAGSPYVANRNAFTAYSANFGGNVNITGALTAGNVIANSIGTTGGLSGGSPFYPLLVASNTSGNQTVNTAAAFNYVPSTGIFSIPTLLASASVQARSSTAVNTNSSGSYYSGAYTGNPATVFLMSGTNGHNAVYIGGAASGAEPADSINFYLGTPGALGAGTPYGSMKTTGMAMNLPITSGTTTFTVSGCGTAGSVTGNGTAGTFTVGTGAGTCTFVFTINGATGMTATHGWIANVDDATAKLHCENTATVSTTTANVICNATVTTGDLITFKADPY